MVTLRARRSQRASSFFSGAAVARQDEAMRRTKRIFFIRLEAPRIDKRPFNITVRRVAKTQTDLQHNILARNPFMPIAARSARENENAQRLTQTGIWSRKGDKAVTRPTRIQTRG